LEIMVSRVSNFSPARWVSRTPDLLAWLGQWWLAEFLALFPERFAEWLTDRGYKKLTLAGEPDAFVLQLSSERHRPLASARIASSAYSPATIDDFLKAHELDRGQVGLGVRLPRDHIFSRRLILPLEAAGSIDEIVVQDLAAKTPFQLPDICHDHQSRTVGDKVVVWQWIVGREFVANAAQSAGLEVDDLAFVDSDSDGIGEAPAPMLTLQKDRSERRSWLRKTFYALALGALFLAVAACAHKYWRHQRILDNLSTELTTARAKAQQIRAALDRLDQKQAAIVRVRSQKRDAPGLLEVWEEASRVLPLDSWLAELRLSEVTQRQDQLVVMTGLSTGAADLVALIDKSPLFADAALTAPIALDSIEQRERFTLQAKLKQKRQIATPAP
jgi:general secretion pathway protein L